MLCGSARAVEGLRRWLTRLQEAGVSVPCPLLSLNLPVLCTLLLLCNGKALLSCYFSKVLA